MRADIFINISYKGAKFFLFYFSSKNRNDPKWWVESDFYTIHRNFEIVHFNATEDWHATGQYL
jgi:hypothetical protein